MAFIVIQIVWAMAIAIRCQLEFWRTNHRNTIAFYIYCAIVANDGRGKAYAIDDNKAPGAIRMHAVTILEYSS